MRLKKKRKADEQKTKNAQQMLSLNISIVTRTTILQLFLKHIISHVLNWMKTRFCLRQMYKSTVVDVFCIMQSS